MRTTFAEELTQLEQSLLGEGDLVIRSLRAAARALAEEDVELADEVIAFDDDVDARYFAIEEGILDEFLGLPEQMSASK